MENPTAPPNLSAACARPIPSAFLFDLEGHSVVAAKVANRVAKQISGQDMETAGIISRLKAKLGLTKERW